MSGMHPGAAAFEALTLAMSRCTALSLAAGRAETDAELDALAAILEDEVIAAMDAWADLCAVDGAIAQLHAALLDPAAPGRLS